MNADDALARYHTATEVAAQTRALLREHTLDRYVAAMAVWAACRTQQEAAELIGVARPELSQWKAELRKAGRLTDS